MSYAVLTQAEDVIIEHPVRVNFSVRLNPTSFLTRCERTLRLGDDDGFEIVTVNVDTGERIRKTSCERIDDALLAFFTLPDNTI